MRMLQWFCLLVLFCSSGAHALSGPTVATENVKSRLVSEASSIGPGQSIWVGVDFEIRSGWHTYWRNPGDSGQATTVAWNLPPGFTAGDILWPEPHRFDLPPLVNYGYAGHVLHLVEITAPKDFKPGRAAALSAKVSYLVCSDVCIPEDAALQLELPTSTVAGVADPAAVTLFSAARGELPQAAPAATQARIDNGQLILVLGKAWGATLPRISSLVFFPYDAGNIEYAAPQILTRSRDALQLGVKLGYMPPAGDAVRGVLLATEQQDGEQAVTVPIEIAAALGTAAGASTAAAAPPLPLLSLLLLAVLGGLILNLMPCVFPVLSIKAIGLVEQAKKNPAAVRRKGLAFAAGVVGSMLVLAAVLLALRAGGEEIGWGSQFQSPLFVTLMIYLLFAVGLNQSGVFEIGGGLAGVGDSLTRGDGYRAAFFTGVLTTLVATPCTAPFMAAAVGAALTQAPAIALGIFAALGVGLSLPYLLLSFAPVTRRALPRPGVWMDTLKQVFAFPMYASAAWLLWVLAQQTSPLGLGAALAGAILVGLAAWAYQKSKASAAVGRMTALVTALAALLLAIVLPIRFAGVAPVAARGDSAAHDGDSWQPYDATKVAELEAAGRPLLVNFTASWCLTCLVNERSTFADTAVQEIFRTKGVTLMKGDWTNRDPAITKALAAFGRGGVPLYVVYNSTPRPSAPVVLPQLLTAGIVSDTFAGLPNRPSN